MYVFMMRSIDSSTTQYHVTIKVKVQKVVGGAMTSTKGNFADSAYIPYSLGMPFPKLLAKAKVWIGVLFLLLLAMFYIYLRLNKVRKQLISNTRVKSIKFTDVCLASFDRPRKRRKRAQLAFPCFGGSLSTTSHLLTTVETLDKATHSLQMNWVSISLQLK